MNTKMPMKKSGKIPKNPKSPPISDIVKSGIKANTKMRINGKMHTKLKGDHLASDDNFAVLHKTQNS
jgi:hypothetical protein